MVGLRSAWIHRSIALQVFIVLDLFVMTHGLERSIQHVLCLDPNPRDCPFSPNPGNDVDQEQLSNLLPAAFILHHVDDCGQGSCAPSRATK